MRVRPWIPLAAALATPLGAQAQAPSADGACGHATGVADSEAALLMSPELFVSLGVVSAALDEEGLGAPTPRLLIGADYSVSKLWQGMTVKRRALAECERARALAALAPALDLRSSLGLLPALTARSQVLKDALPRAEAIARAVASEVEDGRASREEERAIAQALDGLRLLAHQTALDADRLQRGPAPADFQAALRRYRDASARAEALSGSLRAQSAWDVAVRGGYERLFDVPQSVPLFGMVTVSYNLGGLFQGDANRRAVAGVRQESDGDFDSVGQKLRQLLDELSAQRAADRTRLEQARTRLADLQSQARQLEALTTHEVDRFRRSVFFERVSAEAEVAFLEAHLRALEALTKEPLR